MRICHALILWGLLCLVGLLPATSFAADERQVFRFGDEATGGALIHDYANRWVEMGGAQERFLLVEVARTDDEIELRDPSRNVGFKIHSDRGELLLNNSTTWQPWQRGQWIAMSDLPNSIEFVPTDQQIRLAYFVPTDRQPIPNHEQKIRVVMQVVAELYRRDLKAKGYDSDGFKLESNAASEPVIHLIRAEKEARFYNGAPAFDEVKHFQRIEAEIPSRVGSTRRHVIVVFAETYEPGPAAIEWNGSVGRGGNKTADGGVAIMSSWILRDEFCATSLAQQKKMIFDTTPIAGRAAMGTRQPNSPRYEFIEDGFGAVAHELGHALGLPHDYRQPNDMMGRGFRNLQFNFRSPADKTKVVTFSRDNARLLGVSRYLVSDLDLSDNTLPTAELSVRLLQGAAPAVTVSLKATDDRELRAVVFYDPQNDTVVGSHQLKGLTQSIDQKLFVPAIKPGEFKIRAMLADGGGNVAHIEATAGARRKAGSAAK